MKKQILVVDDSKAIRFLLQTVLGKTYNVVTMQDGYSAMYWLSKKNFPDLIIADPQLPDMNEWELIHHLSSSGIYGSIPIVVLSALGLQETEIRCSEIGIRKFFLKPFNPVELANMLKVILDESTTEAIIR